VLFKLRPQSPLQLAPSERLPRQAHVPLHHHHHTSGRCLRGGLRLLVHRQAVTHRTFSSIRCEASLRRRPDFGVGFVFRLVKCRIILRICRNSDLLRNLRGTVLLAEIGNSLNAQRTTVSLKITAGQCQLTRKKSPRSAVLAVRCRFISPEKPTGTPANPLAIPLPRVSPDQATAQTK